MKKLIYRNMPDCLFCKIINKEIPAKIVYESDQILVFPDINPSADLHLLMVPKKHLGGISELNAGHKEMLWQICQAINKLVLENNLTEDSYRVVVNGGKAQHIPHLHFHLLGGQWKKYV